MNTETGEMFDSRDEAIEESLIKGLSRKEAEALIVAIKDDEVVELKGMNRAQRRRWAKEHK